MLLLRSNDAARSHHVTFTKRSLFFHTGGGLSASRRLSVRRQEAKDCGGSRPPTVNRLTNGCSVCHLCANSARMAHSRRHSQAMPGGENPSSARLFTPYGNSAQLPKTALEETENPRVAGSTPALGTIFLWRFAVQLLCQGFDLRRTAPVDPL
jgi:hypothetical protein